MLSIMRFIMWCLLMLIIQFQQFIRQIVMVNKLVHNFKSMVLHIKLMGHMNHKPLVIKQQLIKQLVIKQLVKQRLSGQQLKFFKLVSIERVIQLFLKLHIQLLVR